jgi:hypothetical protein
MTALERKALISGTCWTGVILIIAAIGLAHKWGWL